MAYQRMNLHEEDKWDIHSSSYRQDNYSSNSKKEIAKYTHEQYNRNSATDYKANDDYRKVDDKEERKQLNEEESIESAILNERMKQDQEEDIQVIAAKQLSHEFQSQNPNPLQSERKKFHSIEEAVNLAIKKEKETIVRN